MYQYLSNLEFYFLVWTDSCPGMPIFRFFHHKSLSLHPNVTKMVHPNALCKKMKSIWPAVQVWFTAELLEFSTWRIQGTQNIWFFLNRFIYCVPLHKSHYIQVVLKKLKIYIYCTTAHYKNVDWRATIFQFVEKFDNDIPHNGYIRSELDIWFIFWTYHFYWKQTGLDIGHIILLLVE